MNDLDGAAGVLARAFHDDPYIGWVEPDPDRRARISPAIFRCVLEHGIRRGRVLVRRGQGSAHWFSPERVELRAIDDVQCGYVRLLLAHPLVTRRLLSHEAQAGARVHPFLKPGVAYLHTIGIEPSLKGQGLGSRLLRSALEQIGTGFDRCVLRTEQPKNVAFYLKNGFKIVDEFVFRRRRRGRFSLLGVPWGTPDGTGRWSGSTLLITRVKMVCQYLPGKNIDRLLLHASRLRARRRRSVCSQWTR